jgi:hypothetical protein
MQIVVAIFAKIAFICGMTLFGVGFYQQGMFVGEWYEDHARPGNWVTRALLSTKAIFHPALSERCRRRRRRLVMAVSGAFGLVPIAVLLQRLIE